MPTMYDIMIDESREVTQEDVDRMTGAVALLGNIIETIEISRAKFVTSKGLPRITAKEALNLLYTTLDQARASGVIGPGAPLR